MLFTSKKFKFSDLNFGPENDGGSWEGGGGLNGALLPPIPHPAISTALSFERHRNPISLNCQND